MPKNQSPAFFAILSDIHGNIEALEAVLAEIQEMPVRGTFCLGDIVGYGPDPAACVQRVMDTCVVSVFGNHEAMLFLADQFPPEELVPSVGEPLLIASRQLQAEQMKWLRALPIQADLDPITLSHASLNSPADFHYIDSTDQAEEHFAAQATDISFQGHTHVPVIWEKSQSGIRCYKPEAKAVRLEAGNRYAVNVGSVGQPRDDDPRACYALYDHTSRILVHRRVEYDIEAAQKRFREAGLPDRNWKRLAKGA